MSSKNYEQFTASTPGVRWVRLPATLLPNGTDDPIMGEGDTKQTNYMPARTGPGVYTVTTVDKFVALVAVLPGLCLDTPDSYMMVVSKIQNADLTFTITFTVYDETGTAAELEEGDAIFFECVFRNTDVKP